MWSDEPWRESEQWALFCGQDGNLSRDTSAGREVASPCTDVITACVWFTLHLLSASCFTFHLSWQSLNLNLWSSSMCLIPPLLTEWKQLQGYWCYGGKNVFISARTAGHTAAHSHSSCHAHLNSSRDVAYGGWDPDCCTEELKGWIFRSSRHICIWIGAAQCPTHQCCPRLPKSELQSIFFPPH